MLHDDHFIAICAYSRDKTTNSINNANFDEQNRQETTRTTLFSCVFHSCRITLQYITSDDKRYVYESKDIIISILNDVPSCFSDSVDGEADE